MKTGYQRWAYFLLTISAIAGMPLHLHADRDPFRPPWEKRKEIQREENQVDWKSRPVEKQMDYNNAEKENEFYQEEQNVVTSSESESLPVRPNLDLRGIIWRKDGTGMVIIGDRIFHTGDVVVDGCVVGAIVEGTLILKCEDNIWKYRVNGGEGHEKD